MHEYGFVADNKTRTRAGLDMVVLRLELHVMILDSPSAQGGQELEESSPLAPRPGPHSDEGPFVPIARNFVSLSER